MNTLLRSAFTLLLLSTAFCLQAQPPGYQAAVNRAVSNAQFHHFMHSMNNAHMYRTQYLVNNKYEFTVRLKDSSERLIRSRIHTDTVAKVNYLEFDNKAVPKTDPARKERILPTQTLSIRRYDRTTGTFVEGVATDSCWLFEVQTGRISIYSPLSERSITSDYITAFRLADGPIEPISEARLRDIMAGDEKALRALEKKDYYKAIRKYNKAD